MRFSSEEIEGAKRMRESGLAWEPQPGHYVWDDRGLIEKPSPFQEGIYFILDLKHFLRRAGTIEVLKQEPVWLPTWHDARAILRSEGVRDSDVARRLDATRAIENQTELLVLYELIAERLSGKDS